MSKDDTSMVTCKLDQPIRSKLFDQNVSVESFNINTFLQNGAIPPCRCENSPFIDADHGSI